MSRSGELRHGIKSQGWVRTKLAPYRAVMFAPLERDPRSWVEIMSVHDAPTRGPRRFYPREVEPAPPSELMTYDPAPKTPICGYQFQIGNRHNDGSKFCPRPKKTHERFCKRCEQRLAQEEL